MVRIKWVNNDRPNICHAVAGGYDYQLNKATRSRTYWLQGACNLMKCSERDEV